MAFAAVSNPKRLGKDAETSATICIRHLSHWKSAVDEIKSWPEYAPQPLRDLPDAARRLEIGKLLVKDESKRFGKSLGSFKALGAPYSIFKILQKEVYEKTGFSPTHDELRSGKYSEITNLVTVCVATDGNQGRGLAYGAKIFGCRCVIYIHNHVSEGRASAIKALGAIVIRIQGEYEASVDRAKEDARMNGWSFVSSTSWSDFDDSIPQNVMNAYMVVVEEVLAELPAVHEVTHVFVCGGVGSIAAAIFQGFYSRLLGAKEGNMPRFVVVEPSVADCLFQSAKKGEPCPSSGDLRTIMAGLACRAPSPAAWKVLSWLASDFVSAPDSAAVEGMVELAAGKGGDIPVVIGESSAANAGVLFEAQRDRTLRQQLELDGNSQVLIFGLEGSTDPVTYEKLCSVSPEVVFAAQEKFQARFHLYFV
ncbi:unnamed protein product [Clonostachys rosea]|uniref:Tryptophan synthase beta chain-like PALP domain-containing protein n=1 Tax=Bionectria ochroleuca TaxID=29856 RepID=A0ABY6U5U7_BIOOC|nr:unnamed protein product [Clonostachys rosea]